jgi:hypothetical protein
VNPNAIVEQTTYVHPAVACAMLLAAALMLVIQQRYLLVPIFLGGLLIPMDQVLVLGPFHFQMLRILILLGWVRVVFVSSRAPHPLLTGGFNTLDKLVIGYLFFDALDFVLLWGGSSDALINRCGNLYTSLGTYFLLRVLIRDKNDADIVIRTLACAAAVIAVSMLVEQGTGHNPYSMFGGARAWTRQELMSRSDRFRAMGPFGHPITAGSFGGMCLPCFAGLWMRSRGKRSYAVLGIVSATVIVITSASSTPIMAYLFGVFALALWPMRAYVRALRWLLVIGIIALSFVMKAPVWALIERVDLVGGSSSAHRYQLVDQTIRHFSEWWLFGIKSTADWGDSMWDHANQYVAIATGSGLIPLIFFIAIIVHAFSLVGRARRRKGQDRKLRLAVWSLGAALTANLVAFFGISYFDQTIMVWWGQLAMIAAFYAFAPARSSAGTVFADVPIDKPLHRVPLSY